MKYCMSDIHGESERYFQMLKEIQFSSDDSFILLEMLSTEALVELRY